MKIADFIITYYSHVQFVCYNHLKLYVNYKVY